MTVTVLGLWETGWMEAERTERRLWKQSIQAFEVDAWAMCGVRGGPFTSPVQHDDLAAMLAAHVGPKTFLMPKGTADAAELSYTDLVAYAHPSDAIYVFGNSGENLVSSVGPEDEVVAICTPAEAAMFASSAVVAVLYDRLAKAAP